MQWENDMSYGIEDQQLHQQAIAMLVNCGAVISLRKTYQAEFVGRGETVIVFFEICAQGSV
jgi:hypothetical protein